VACATNEPHDRTGPKNRDRNRDRESVLGKQPDPRGTNQTADPRASSARSPRFGSCHLLNYKIWQGINLASPCCPGRQNLAQQQQQQQKDQSGSRITILADPNHLPLCAMLCFALLCSYLPSTCRPESEYELKTQTHAQTRIRIPVIWKTKRKVRLNSYNDSAGSRFQPADPVILNSSAPWVLLIPKCCIFGRNLLAIVCLPPSATASKSVYNLCLFRAQSRKHLEMSMSPAPVPLTLHLYHRNPFSISCLDFVVLIAGALPFVWVLN